MRPRYRLYRRHRGVFYLYDNETRKRESLHTSHREEARQILHARNQALRQPAINLQIARAYLMAGDPEIAKRTWQSVMDEMGRCKQGSTKERWIRAMAQKAFDAIRNLTLLETRAEHFLNVLAAGTISTNSFLRRLHNYTLDMTWLLAPVIPRRQWPPIRFKDKRGITHAEHQRILAGERNPERHAYYSLLWHIGGSQSDVATLCAEDVDWNNKVISFQRMKTDTVAQLHFGPEVEHILSDLPGQGLLFPRIARQGESDRASLFSRRCRLVGVSGVSLHSYHYAWAERAKTVGYPERFAQEALGHNSKAVHRAYAKKARVKLPALEDFEKSFAETKQLAASAPPTG